MSRRRRRRKGGGLPDEAIFEAARRVLTDREYLTWAMARKGISRQDIADHRHVSKGAVNSCLAECRRKIGEELGESGKTSQEAL